MKALECSKFNIGVDNMKILVIVIMFICLCGCKQINVTHSVDACIHLGGVPIIDQEGNLVDCRKISESK
jgi:hypothetical protein